MDVDLLKNIPLFASLDRTDLADLSILLTPLSVAAHQTVFWIGDRGDYLCIVQSGQVEVVQPDDTGKEITLGSIGPGGFFGELSLLDGGSRTATVRTTRDSVFLTLNREGFLRFLTRHPGASVLLLLEIAKRQRDMLEILRGVKNVNQVMDARLTVGQRFATGFAALMGSWKYLILQTTVCTGWIIANAILRDSDHSWDPYPFNLLSLVLTAVAGYAAPIIMMSQARQSEKDRIRTELEYQVNVKAHAEVMHLHKKIDLLGSLLQKRTLEAMSESGT